MSQPHVNSAVAPEQQKFRDCGAVLHQKKPAHVARCSRCLDGASHSAPVGRHHVDRAVGPEDVLAGLKRKFPRNRTLGAELAADAVRNHADEGVHDLAEERGLDQLIAWREFFEQNPAIFDGTAKLSEELAAGLRLDGTGYEGEVEAAAAAPLEEAVPLEAAEEL